MRWLLGRWNLQLCWFLWGLVRGRTTWRLSFCPKFKVGEKKPKRREDLNGRRELTYIPNNSHRQTSKESALQCWAQFYGTLDIIPKPISCLTFLFWNAKKWPENNVSFHALDLARKKKKKWSTTYVINAQIHMSAENRHYVK